MSAVQPSQGSGDAVEAVEGCEGHDLDGSGVAVMVAASRVVELVGRAAPGRGRSVVTARRRSPSSRTSAPMSSSPATFATVRPDGLKSYGPAAVERLAEVGVQLLPWQAEVLAEWLVVDDAGRLVNTSATLLCPRRNGKSTLILARVLFGMLHLGERRVVYSAHLADSARSAFRDFVAMTEHPRLRPRRTKLLSAEGREEVHFDNGSRFTLRTRTGHGGRGLEADLLVMDEALVLSEEVIAALTPLTARAAAAGRGQVIYASSAGTNGVESLVLAKLRDRGRELHGQPSPGFAFHEWAAERADDPADPSTWAKANPSLGTPLLDERFLEDARSRLTVEAFAREHLGLWADTARLPLVDPAEWAQLAAVEAPVPLDASSWWAFDLGTSLEGLTTSSRVLGFYRDQLGRIAVRVVDSVSAPDGLDLDLIAQRILGLAEHHDPDVIGYEGLTGSGVASVLERHGWKDRLRKITGARAAAGVAQLLTAVRTGQLVHDGHQDLADDLSRAVGRPFGDGGVVFARKGSEGIAGAIALGAGLSMAADELIA